MSASALHQRLAPTSASSIAGVGVEQAPSWLSQRLATHAHSRRAVELARAQFLAGRRVDMGGLAATMGVDRTSVFRWVGNRDALLTEVLWSIAVPTLVQADRATQDRCGADRVAELLQHFVADLITADYFRDFLRREPARALRLLTTRASQLQRRYVATVEWLVRRDLGETPLAGAIDPATLAFLLVRVSESFTYSDLIAGETPDAARAYLAFRLLLRVD